MTSALNNMNDESSEKNYNRMKEKVKQYDIEKIYSRSLQLGVGTYGEVYRSMHHRTKKIVAVKQLILKDAKEGLPITALREIMSLKSLSHPNIVELMDCVANWEKAQFSLVFEYLKHDLNGLLSKCGNTFSLEHRKDLSLQLLKGIKYMHEKRIIHRDLKTSNILVDENGCLKIADFGLSRTFPKSQQYALSLEIVTRWYRPPEIFLKDQKYTEKVDMWSVGCILAEIFTGKPILQGKDDKDQLIKIFKLCGTPTEETWSGVTKLTGFKPIENMGPFRDQFEETFVKSIPDEAARDLIRNLLVCDPTKRLTAKEALAHRWFSQDPPPKRLGSDLLPRTTCNELTMKEEYKRSKKEAMERRPRSNHPSGGPYKKQEEMIITVTIITKIDIRVNTLEEVIHLMILVVIIMVLLLVHIEIIMILETIIVVIIVVIINHPVVTNVVLLIILLIVHTITLPTVKIQPIM
eukprot:CAMPEP_0117432090 /NCGR_PEP_ID=MMETSP0758-20121206/11616_1 /TAXON_ID=63605 /ORGANISM="Percolomonas cosmopolitus, Strain AE-1 (ATCC 50343)" /LENGTH=463 /DNA_ID=CAMNT_0005221735 /DNA_START=39 /DNA_END=1431 /DNA_ORIENTATION=+